MIKSWTQKSEFSSTDRHYGIFEVVDEPSHILILDLNFYEFAFLNPGLQYKFNSHDNGKFKFTVNEDEEHVTNFEEMSDLKITYKG
jgi:hypothetical protein